MMLVKVLSAIRFKSSPYVASYIANNTAKCQQFKQDNVYKLINNAPYGQIIDNVARRYDIRLLNDMKKVRRLAVKSVFVDFCKFESQVAPADEQVDGAVAKKQQRQKSLVGIELQNLNHFINKPFAMASVY